jgi:LysM repeat protein
MYTRTLFLIGFPLLLLAVGGLMLLSVRSLPTEALVTRVATEVRMSIPTAPKATITATPVSPPAMATPVSTAVIATPTTTGTAPPAGTAGFWHRVRHGETLFSIGRLYGVNAYTICSVNRLSNCNYVWAGQELWIPTYAHPGPYPGPYPGPGELPTTTPPQISTPTTPPLVETLTPTPTSAPATLMPPLLTSTPAPSTGLPTVSVNVEWPRRMEIDRSDSIRVSLVRSTGPSVVSVTILPGHTATAFPLPTVGTPEIRFEEAFGPDYKGFAVANLAGSAFDVTPLTTLTQSLEQTDITWVWNIAPKRGGRHVVNVYIEFQWKPTRNDGEIIQRQMWISSPLEIDVNEPLIATGQLSLFTLVGGLIGSGLSVPWLYERLEARRKKLNSG